MPLVAGRLVRAARRLYPVALMAYRRWQTLSPEEKERYRVMARTYSQRGRDAFEQRRARGRRGGRGDVRAPEPPPESEDPWDRGPPPRG